VVEQKLITEIGKAVGQIIPDASVKELIKEIAEKALLLASNMIIVQPRMAIISAKNGEAFNPEKHEDITAEYKFVVTSLVCTVDNNVFVKASVETKVEKF
jgi:hypothetical protein